MGVQHGAVLPAAWGWCWGFCREASAHTARERMRTRRCWKQKPKRQVISSHAHPRVLGRTGASDPGRRLGAFPKTPTATPLRPHCDPQVHSCRFVSWSRVGGEGAASHPGCWGLPSAQPWAGLRAHLIRCAGLPCPRPARQRDTPMYWSKHCEMRLRDRVTPKTKCSLPFRRGKLLSG